MNLLHDREKCNKNLKHLVEYLNYLGYMTVVQYHDWV